jgi:hypothetical protein
MSAIATGEGLRRKIRLAAPLVAPSAEAFWAHPKLRELFPQFLMAIHGSVSCTVPLMEAAMRKTKHHHGDPICAHLADYFPKHIVEEADHEEWLLRDLEALGVNREDVRARPPNRAIAGMVGAQYYWILHTHPVALLGFFAVLEGHPPEVEHLLDIERRTALPAEAFRMLKYHAVADQGHAGELFALLDRLPLGLFHVELIGISALHTLAMLKIFFESLIPHPPVISPGC